MVPQQFLLVLSVVEAVEADVLVTLVLVLVLVAAVDSLMEHSQ